MGYCHIESYTGENVSRGIAKRENDVVHFDHWADPFVRLLLVKISGCALTVVKNAQFHFPALTNVGNSSHCLSWRNT